MYREKFLSYSLKYKKKLDSVYRLRILFSQISIYSSTINNKPKPQANYRLPIKHNKYYNIPLQASELI